jgi:exopolyphosphatase / guanosine-5'-triphosphate,3'-diphosphate pyrophosphatase
MGSNSFRLELARMVSGRYERQAYFKETVRLGGGLDEEGQLSGESMLRALACLTRFAAELQQFPQAKVRAVATQTLREAKNTRAFLQQAQEALGHPIEIISGREEARLTFCGVSHLEPGLKRRLVIDIGGRSTEMILGRGDTPRVAESFAVGSVGLSMAHFGNGKLTDKAFRAAQVAAGAELEEAVDLFKPSMWEEALGSSGTVSAVSQWLDAAGKGRVITPALLRWCIEQCLQAGHIRHLNLMGMREDRRPVVAGGLSLLYTLCMQFGIKRLSPSRGALRQGVIIDMHQRALINAMTRRLHRSSIKDPRQKAIDALQRRYGVDVAHAKRVREAAMAMQTQWAASLAGEALDSSNPAMVTSTLLGFACDLHELGQAVSHHDFHRHGAYLLMHADVPGFSQNEQATLSALVLGQRGSLSKVASSLTSPESTVPLMALRLAVVLCHARSPAPTRGNKAFQFRVHGHQATLTLHPDWVRGHPGAMHGLNLEAQTWQRQSPWRLRVRIATTA